MKFSPRAVLFIVGALAGGALSAVAQQSTRDDITVIPRPRVSDGSNASRAPFPAERRFDDVKAPDGAAVDQDLPPNTPATEPTEAPPVTVAILQSEAPAADATLSMTGRPTVGVSASLEANRIAAAIRAQPDTAREQLFTDIDTRLAASATALRGFRDSTREMSAANRDQFEAAADDLKAKEKALKKSLNVARKADAQNWQAARAQLAADYEAYAAAAARLDALAGIQVANP